MTAAFWYYSSNNDSWYISSSLQEALTLNNSPTSAELVSTIPAVNRFGVLRQFCRLFLGKLKDGIVETTLQSRNNETLQIKTELKRISGGHGEIKIEGTVDFIKSPSSFLQIPSVAKIVYENTSEGILVTDSNGQILSVNKGFSRITGYSYEEVIGKRPSILKSNKQDQDFYQILWHSIMHDGAWTGTLWNRKKDGSLFASFQNISQISSSSDPVKYVSVFSDITLDYNYKLRLKQLAYYDQLTGLQNRAYLRHKVNSLIEKNKALKFNLLFIDLDNYKPINDKYGHAYGDEILKLVAKQLKSTLSGKLEIARFGGDEFIVFIPNYSESELRSYITKIKTAMLTPLEHKGNKHRLSASIGVSAYPQDGKNFDELLVASDLAMYFAKSTKQRDCAYIQDMGYSASRHALLARDFVPSLRSGQFSLVYQSKVDINSRRIVGVEALCRWQHPEFGTVSPQEFITIADQYALHSELTEWVLNKACTDFRQVLKANPNVDLAINVSGSQLKTDRLVKAIKTVCEVVGVSANQLVLEITEGEIIADVNTSIRVLENLREIGVKIAIDDFGKGYSSFYYLRTLPINTLKLDKACLHSDENDDSTTLNILSAVVNLTESMNLALVVEGVENEHHLALVEQVGASTVQGFYFSKPQPFEVFSKQFEISQQ
ncbi:EAL domain-containing protein [Alteromonas gracilis]|uniref:sensor domain-containing protein n=1 Tax=Alteromonas gracilis TaxID=1479524 RepID=UPI00373685A6